MQHPHFTFKEVHASALWDWELWYFSVIGFCCGSIQISYLRPPLNSPAQAHAFWYLAYHSRPKWPLFWFLWFQGFRFGYFLVSIQMLNSPAEPIATIPQTLQMDLKCLRYPGGLEQTHTQHIYIHSSFIDIDICWFWISNHLHIPWLWNLIVCSRIQWTLSDKLMWQF